MIEKASNQNLKFVVYEILNMDQIERVSYKLEQTPRGSKNYQEITFHTTTISMPQSQARKCFRVTNLFECSLHLSKCNWV